MIATMKINTQKLLEMAKNLDYIKLNLIQSFSPDTVDEAKNRGFRPA